MPDIALEMRNISKTFPGVTALDNVNITLYKGEILALIGENGAGKSTLMKILSGVYPSGTYKGDIYIYDEKVNFASPRDSRQAGIAMIYQEISMHLDLTVAENIFLGKWETGKGIINWQHLNKRAREVLTKLDFDLNPGEILRNLNISQQQIVAIARALSEDPRILVLDEPTSALTENESKNLFEIIKGLKEKGISVILITHKLEEVFANADRICVLREGKLINAHVVKEIKEQQKIINEMIGRELCELYPLRSISCGKKEILQVHNLTIRHPYIPGKNIIESISFAVNEGEIVGIYGLVGSGKSEIVNAIFGKQRYQAEIWICGEKVEINKPRDAISAGIGLVTEDRFYDGFIGLLDIKANVSLASLKTISRRGIIQGNNERQMAADFIKKLRIKASSYRTKVQTLSGGNQQKVVLAKWLAITPRILLLDEPTRGIDVGSKQEVYQIINDLAQQGTAVVMASSELPELIGMCDRIIVIAKGKIQGEILRGEFCQERVISLANCINR
ncbi:sugar ABC transporter ATP-binding protein [Moorella naiadis]|uniref:sugar ABC transporter ATP-binding protein n=1 Tax=Moorella naiadis (nom. illeg.) TaxID=3093670 RepID=UPI003D9C9391